MQEATLAGRRLLITAGPTWVMLDAVRHLGNFSTGGTGLALARAAADRGAAVTLLMGPGRALPTAGDRARFRVVDLVTFDDLRGAVHEHAASRAYDAMLHLAAVSDYRPVEEFRGKLPSREEELVIRLRPTPKIVDEVRGLDPEILLVKFKLEVDCPHEELRRIAEASRARSDADLVVANDLSRLGPGRHPALILDRDGPVAAVETPAELCRRLLDAVAHALRDRAPRAGTPPAERGPA